MSEAVYEWNEFQILQKSYVIKRKLEIVLLNEALLIFDFEFIALQMSHYCENASMFGFPELGELALKIKSYTESKNCFLISGGLEQFQTLIKYYEDSL